MSMERNKVDYQRWFDLSDVQLSEPMLVYRSSTLMKDKQHVTHFERAESSLPFSDFQFSFALSSYPFFTASEAVEQIVLELEELARVAKEVRIAPLMFQEAQVELVLGPVMLMLQQKNYGVEVRVLADKQSALLRIWALGCAVT